MKHDSKPPTLNLISNLAAAAVSRCQCPVELNEFLLAHPLCGAQWLSGHAGSCLKNYAVALHPTPDRPCLHSCASAVKRSARWGEVTHATSSCRSLFLFWALRAPRTHTSCQDAVRFREGGGPMPTAFTLLLGHGCSLHAQLCSITLGGWCSSTCRWA